MPNPLAIGVTLGGLLLDILVPRPKPRAGFAAEPALLSNPTDVRTPEYGGARTVRTSAGRERMARSR